MPVHFTKGNLTPACQDAGGLHISYEPGEVTCFACRRTPVFIESQGGGSSTPPVKLSGVMATSEDMQALHRAGLAYIVKRGLNSGTNDGEHEALTELADALGLSYDDDTESYT